jgi:hypothetical protein
MRKPPSQIKRNKKRMDEFLAKKLETQASVERKDNTAEKVILVKNSLLLQKVRLIITILVSNMMSLKNWKLKK